MSYDFIGEMPALTVDAIPEEHVQYFLSAILPTLSKQMAEDFTIRAARSFLRKGYESFDTVGGRRNPAYGRDDDDFAIQISIRVRPDDEAYPALIKLHDEIAMSNAEKARAASEARVEALRSELAIAEAALEAHE